MTIIIRLAKKGDGKKVIIMRNEVIRRGFSSYTGTNRTLDSKDVRRYNKTYASKKKNEIIFLAFDDETNKVVGTSSFKAEERGRTRHRGEIGRTVHPDYARKGIATGLVKAALKEAKRRGFKRAEAEAAIENMASIRLAKKCGFRIEGRKKAGLLLDDGRYVDTYIFGKILR